MENDAAGSLGAVCGELFFFVWEGVGEDELVGTWHTGGFQDAGCEGEKAAVACTGPREGGFCRGAEALYGG